MRREEFDAWAIQDHHCRFELEGDFPKLFLRESEAIEARNDGVITGRYVVKVRVTIEEQP